MTSVDHSGSMAVLKLQPNLSCSQTAHFQVGSATAGILVLAVGSKP